MLQITIPGTELWNSEKNEFITSKAQTIQLEHSLVALSKWEAKWCKPFLTKKEHTYEETIDYIRCMTITQNVDFNSYYSLSEEDVKRITDYINAPMTASFFIEDKNLPTSNEQTTSELIYYWMVALQIPFECQKWHLNRLFTLIKIVNHKNKPPKKMSQREIMQRNSALNAQRRAQLNSKG